MVGREETVDDSEILAFIDECRDPVVTTGEVAEHFEFSKNGVRKRLYSLADRKLVDFKKSGRVPMFWITDDGREYLAEESND